MPFKVMTQLINHPLTEKGLQQSLCRLAQGSLIKVVLTKGSSDAEE
jgi:hypothetical protein